MASDLYNKAITTIKVLKNLNNWTPALPFRPWKGHTDRYYMGTDQQLRKQHYHRLVDHYYEHLALMMTKLGLQPDEVYGREEFDGDLKAKLPIALSVAATVLPFVTVDPVNAPNFERIEFVPRANELFNERFRGLVQDLKQWGAL